MFKIIFPGTLMVSRPSAATILWLAQCKNYIGLQPLYAVHTCIYIYNVIITYLYIYSIFSNINIYIYIGR